MTRIKIDRILRPELDPRLYEIVSPWLQAFWTTMSIFGALYLIRLIFDEHRWQAIPLAAGAYALFLVQSHYEKRKMLAKS